MDPSFNETYYATLAQVIPVFSLVMIASFFWKLDQSFSPVSRGLLNLACLGFVVFGEAIVLDSLKARETPSAQQEVILNAAVVIPLLRIAAPLAIEAISEAFAGARVHLRRRAAVGVVGFVVVGSATYILSGGSSQVLSWFLVSGLGAMLVGAAYFAVKPHDGP